MPLLADSPGQGECGTATAGLSALTVVYSPPVAVTADYSPPVNKSFSSNDTFLTPAKNPAPDNATPVVNASPRSARQPRSRPLATAEKLQLAEGLKPVMEPELTRLGYSDVAVESAGGMGLFYRARRNGKWVALKVNIDGSFEAEAMLYAEAEIGKALSLAEAGKAEKFFPDMTESPGIEVLTLPSGEKIPVQVSEFIPEVMKKGPTVTRAKSLDEISDDHWRQHPEHWPEVQRQISEAIARMHAYSDPILHLDLKPSNILVSFDVRGKPHVKIIDFGLSRSLNGTVGKPHEPGAIMGTPAFMAPEAWRGEHPTPANDVYALRAVDWNHRLRMASDPAVAHAPTSPYTVPRYLTPNKLSSGANAGRPTPRSEPYYTPSVAFDNISMQTGHPLPLPDRLVAYAEFSQRPRTISERQKLIQSAEGDPKQFFADARRDLMKMDESALVQKPALRYRAAMEFLESTVLTDMWAKPGGIEWKSPDGKFQRGEWEAIVRGAYAVQFDSRAHATDPTVLGPRGVHSQLNFDRFFAKAEELAKLGLIKDLKQLEHEALLAHVVTPSLGLTP